MKRKTKRTWGQWLAGLLSVVIVLALLLPAGALAEEDETLPAQDGPTVDGTEAPAGDGEAAPAPDETTDIGAVSDPENTETPAPAQKVQALIDALPDAESITADNRADVQAQLDAIGAAMLEMTGDEAAALDTARYDAALAALSALDAQTADPDPDPDLEPAPDPDPDPEPGAGPSALEQVQALIDALPDPETITAETRAGVEAQLGAIDQAKQALGDEELDGLDITRYMAAVEAILALDNMAGADIPKTIAFPDELTGSGDSDSPYQISTADQLKQLSEYVNGGKDCQDTYFVLTANIDLGGSAWTPIGVSTAFNGTFDGGGHTVSGLSVDGTSSYNYWGLFGRIGTGGTVKNLGVSGDINGGGSAAGGVAGYSQGMITGCHSACTVHNGDSTGGIVGENYGTVENCYNVGAVSGSDAGGIVGYNHPRRTVTNCYSTGPVSSSSSSSSGGIVGRNNEGSVTNCYYLENTADQAVGSTYGGTETSVGSRSEDEFRSLASTLGGAWEDDPFLGRPVLKNSREPSPVAGEGTAEHPYLIPDKATLELVRDYINRDAGHGAGEFFKLTGNIDLENDPWTPIGDQNKPFAGTFDGGGYTISGLYINQPYQPYQSLFSMVGTGSTVKNLTVKGSVIGNLYSAGIVGRNEGTVENCCNDGSISGGMATGGIVGVNYNGTVENCHNTGNIIATRQIQVYEEVFLLNLQVKYSQIC